MVASADVGGRINDFTRNFVVKRRAEAAAWFLARPFFLALRPFFVNPHAASKRVLVIQRILRIGDTLVARPALAALRSRYPGARIAVVCAPALAPLCDADPLVDDVIEAKPGWRRAARSYAAGDAYIFVTDRWSPLAARVAGAVRITGYNYAGRGAPLDLRVPPPPRVNVPAFLFGRNAPAIKAADIWVRLVAPGAAAVQAYPALDPGPMARDEASAWSRSVHAEGSCIVICHAGAANRSYLWSAAKWAALARELTDEGAAVVWTGSAAEAAVVAEIARAAGVGAVAAGQLSLLGTFALVSAAKIVISVDTALVHVAATIGTPVIGLYGPGDEEMWSPLGVAHRVVTAPSPCRGCKTAVCFQDNHYCMDAIGADAVAAAFRDLRREVGT